MWQPGMSYVAKSRWIISVAVHVNELEWCRSRQSERMSSMNEMDA